MFAFFINDVRDFVYCASLFFFFSCDSANFRLEPAAARPPRNEERKEHVNAVSHHRARTPQSGGSITWVFSITISNQLVSRWWIPLSQLECKSITRAPRWFHWWTETLWGQIPNYKGNDTVELNQQNSLKTKPFVNLVYKMSFSLFSWQLSRC